MMARPILHAALPLLLLGCAVAQAENSPPISESWNISSSGKAADSGELVFRVTTGEGVDPVEVTVFVLSGTNETGVAQNIRRAFSTQLDEQRFDVAGGEGANVLLTGDRPDARFSVELIDSDVENVRVVVNSVAPVAPPTVPEQAQPANPPLPATPPAPGNATPGNATPPAGPGPATPAPPGTPSAPPAQPSAPPAESSAPPAQPSAPPGAPTTANGGAGAPASAPPPPPGTY